MQVVEIREDFLDIMLTETSELEGIRIGKRHGSDERTSCADKNENALAYKCFRIAFAESADRTNMADAKNADPISRESTQLGSMQEFIDKRDALMPWIEPFYPDALASADDPPVLLFYDNPPNLGQPYKDPPHSANFGAGTPRNSKPSASSIRSISTTTTPT